MSEILGGARVVPVVVIDDVETAVPLAQALLDNGIGVIEVTLRSDAALAAIEAIAKDVPAMVTGAGSLRRPAQFRQVVDAGARFTVSPGASDDLIAAARDTGAPFFPGAATPSEMIYLFEQGITVQKFFPAGVAGGIGMLSAVAGPLPEIAFMPTGGISPDNAADYLKLGNVVCVGGSWITPKALLDKRDYASIGRLAADAAKI